MFARLATRAVKPAPSPGAGLVFAATKPSHLGLRARSVSQKAFAGGSMGRDMPPQKYRTPTSPDAPRAAEATLTIRVRAPSSFPLLSSLVSPLLVLLHFK